MNFSELIPFSGGSRLAGFSPSGFYVAEAAQFRVRVRDSKSLQVLHQFTCADQVSEIAWSPDSLFLLCCMRKRGLAQVWSIEQPGWLCKIDEGVAGLVAACWAPDSRHVLTTAEFHLRVTLWSLTDKAVSYLKHPKACSRGIAFSSDGCLMALAERRNLKDCVSVFDCCSWRLVSHFDTATDDLDGLAWSPDATVLACWDSCLRSQVSLHRPDGTQLHRFCAHSLEQGLGTKCVDWAPSSQFLAVGGYDGGLRLLNNITWEPLTEFRAAESVDASSAVVYKEVLGDCGLPRYEAAADGCVQVPQVRADAAKANPRVGVGAAQFSPCSRYLAFREDSRPGALWICDLARLQLAALLLHRGPVRSFAWDPARGPRLAAVTGAPCVYVWCPAGCLAAQVPLEPPAAAFVVTAVTWHPHANSLLLLSDADACVCFLDQEDDKEN